MEIYLNIAEWGPNGEFGVEAGARYAFGKPAVTIVAGEAALLTAMLPNPKRRSAKRRGRGSGASPASSRRGRPASGAIDACLRRS